MSMRKFCGTIYLVIGAALLAIFTYLFVRVLAGDGVPLWLLLILFVVGGGFFALGILSLFTKSNIGGFYNEQFNRECDVQRKFKKEDARRTERMRSEHQRRMNEIRSGLDAMLTGFQLDTAKAVYKSCIAAGITKFNSEADLERARLALQRDNNKIAMRADADTLRRMVEAAKKSKEVDKLLAAEQERFDKLMEAHKSDLTRAMNEFNVSEITGREKRLYLLKREKASVDGEIALSINAEATAWHTLNAAGKLEMEKEKGWGTAAGIASGIAGPAAGVAVASGIASENAAIRERNAVRQAAHDERMRAWMDEQRNSPAAKARDKLDLKRRLLAHKIKAAETKLIDDTRPAAELLSAINLSAPQLIYTDGGALIISVTAKSAPKFQIYGDVPAIIDGCIAAEVTENGKAVGTAYLNLPVEGLADTMPLSGLCLDGEPGHRYDISLRPKNLWLTEPL